MKTVKYPRIPAGRLARLLGPLPAGINYAGQYVCPPAGTAAGNAGCTG